jgi:hypothetical protein
MYSDDRRPYADDRRLGEATRQGSCRSKVAVQVVLVNVQLVDFETILEMFL